jgi:site-specific DNA-methyltransferase (adenine-specific)
VAHKLDRDFIGIELDSAYACLALKRLALAQEERSIQGYADGVFWERNSMTNSAKKNPDITKEALKAQNLTLFGES